MSDSHGASGQEAVRRVALLAPMRPELRPLVRMLSLRRVESGETSLHSGTIGDAEVVAAITGIGTRAAAEATERLLRSITVDHVVVVGIAGGVHPHTRVGDVVVPALVIHGPTGVEYRPAPLAGTEPRGSLWTSDEFFIDREDVARLAEQGVVALDMETASIAAVCEQRRCPWSVVRAISDMAADTPVDQALFDLTRPDGTANRGAVARYLLRRPWRVPRLARLARDAARAANAAATTAVRALGAAQTGAAPPG